MEHQEKAIEAYLASVVDDEATLAVVIVGSVARGTERHGSDVDLYLVVSDEAWDAAFAANKVAWVEREELDYPGSYIDIKLVSPRYLATAAVRGDDPTRASFAGARIAFSRIDGLADMITAIGTLPADEWNARMQSYQAQMYLYGGYFLGQATQSGDTFLIRHAAMHCVYSAGRAVLAGNQQFLQGPKYLRKGVTAAVSAPAGFVAAWDALIDDPTPDNAAQLTALVVDWWPTKFPREDVLSTFIRDNELAWLTGQLPAEYY